MKGLNYYNQNDERCHNWEKIQADQKNRLGSFRLNMESSAHNKREKSRRENGRYRHKTPTTLHRVQNLSLVPLRSFSHRARHSPSDLLRHLKWQKCDDHGSPWPILRTFNDQRGEEIFS